MDPFKERGDFASALEALGEEIERSKSLHRELQALIEDVERAKRERSDFWELSSEWG